MRWFYILLILGILITAFFVFWILKKRKKIKKKKPSWYICLDGHKVRSQGELIIDNALYLSNINHEYENHINKLKSNFKYDWYIPETDLYIEYFGYWTDSYKKRRKQKVDFYRSNRLKLLEIEPEDIANIYLFLEINLGRFGLRPKQINNSKNNSVQRFCNNCGASLDERF